MGPFSNLSHLCPRVQEDQALHPSLGTEPGSKIYSTRYICQWALCMPPFGPQFPHQALTCLPSLYLPLPPLSVCVCVHSGPSKCWLDGTGFGRNQPCSISVCSGTPLLSSVTADVLAQVASLIAGALSPGPTSFSTTPEAGPEATCPTPRQGQMED